MDSADLYDFVLEKVKENLCLEEEDIDNAKPTTTLTSLGADSYDILSIITDIEIELSCDLLKNVQKSKICTTIQDIVNGSIEELVSKIDEIQN